MFIALGFLFLSVEPRCSSAGACSGSLGCSQILGLGCLCNYLLIYGCIGSLSRHVDFSLVVLCTFSCLAARGVLVSWPRLEPMSSALRTVSSPPPGRPLGCHLTSAEKGSLPSSLTWLLTGGYSQLLGCGPLGLPQPGNLLHHSSQGESLLARRKLPSHMRWSWKWRPISILYASASHGPAHTQQEAGIQAQGPGVGDHWGTVSECPPPSQARGHSVLNKVDGPTGIGLLLVECHACYC